MKKFFAILMAICLVASVICVTAFAADAPADDEPAAGTVLRVRAQKGNDLIKIGDGDYKSFEDGWNYAMEIAGEPSEMQTNGYDRIVVDLYADWNATDGEFTDDFRNGPGFDWDAIYIPDDAKVTLNMRGHTINRGLTNNEDNGEVICVDADADLIINDGTITGGHSDNGAGGIHIKSRSKVTLNNVNIVGNASNEDDGGGIHMLGGSTLVMNGGSFRDNTVDGYEIQYSSTMRFYGGAIYVNDSTATFNNVEFKNNNTTQHSNYGAAIYAEDSDVTIKGCTFDGNGISDKENDFYGAYSIVHGEDSTLTVTESTFINNGAESSDTIYVGFSGVFVLDDSKLFMEKCRFSGNKSYVSVNDVDDSLICVTDTEFIDNNSGVFRGDSGTSEYSFFRGCKFNNNAHYGRDYLPTFYNIKMPLTFYNCSMGNSTTVSESKVNMKYVNDNLSSSIVLNVSALKTDGTTEAINDYYVFEDGWNAAMELAKDVDAMKANGYERIVIKMLTDWTANNGQFTDDTINGAGFDWNAIFVPSYAKVTLDMDGHTIDRDLQTEEIDGEVIHIDENADVIINNGTITGGWSCNGAGGIFIDNDAKVELNNVNVIGNRVTFDDGAGIGVYAGATLVMNGGSVSDNVLIVGFSIGGTFYGGGVFAERATVTLNGVTIANNINDRLVSCLKGSAVGSKDSMVTLKNCLIKDNGLITEYRKDKSDEEATESTESTDSIVFAWGGTMVIENTDFIGNGTKDAWAQSEAKHVTALINVDNAELTMTGGKVTDNNQVFLFQISNGAANVKGVDCTGNESLAMYRKGKYASKPTSTFTDCKFSAGTPYTPYEDEFYQFVYDFMFGDENANITFVDCDFGDATFDNKSAAKFENTANGVGSLFGEGSLTNILVIISLIASGVSISLTLNYNKKKTVPATYNDEAKTENEE